MAEVDFADGFEVSEPLLWGLTASQLGTLTGGAALAYAAIRSPLPAAVAIGLAALLTGVASALALVRVEGRVLVAWFGAVARFRLRPRHGLLVVQGDGDAAAPGPWQAPASRCADAPGAPARRAHLVLLPEPAGSADGERARSHAEIGPGSGPPRLRVADAVSPVAPAERWAPPRVRRGEGGLEADDGGFPIPLRATRRITFFSLAGGSGRTTLAVEVAGLLAGRSAAPWPAPGVALIDLDLASPRASLRLGAALLTDWADAMAELAASGAVDRLVRTHPGGLRVVPGPAAVPLAGGDAGWRGSSAGQGCGCTPRTLPERAAGWALAADPPAHLGRLVTALERAGCETILLDTPAGLGPVTRWALEAAHDVVVVLTATAGGLQDAYRSTEALRRLGLGRKLRYAVNRGGAHLFSEAMADLGGRVVAAIPEDPALERAEAEHRLVAVETAGATAAALRSLAATFDARLGIRPPAGSGPRRLRGRRAVCPSRASGETI